MTTKKNNATCAVCGKGYYVCKSCKEQAMLNPWKIHTDTSEHYKIFQIVRGYSIGLYTKDDAREKLKDVDLSGLESFLPRVRATIDFIIGTSMYEGSRVSSIDANKDEGKPKKARKGRKKQDTQEHVDEERR